MQIKIFTLPALNSEQTEEEANKFLRSHRVMTVDRAVSRLLCKQVVEVHLALHHTGMAAGHHAVGGDEGDDGRLARLCLMDEEGGAVAQPLLVVSP